MYLNLHTSDPSTPTRSASLSAFHDKRQNMLIPRTVLMNTTVAILPVPLRCCFNSIVYIPEAMATHFETGTSSGSGQISTHIYTNSTLFRFNVHLLFAALNSFVVLFTSDCDVNINCLHFYTRIVLPPFDVHLAH